jgi:hypothetical protein
MKIKTTTSLFKGHQQRINTFLDLQTHINWLECGHVGNNTNIIKLCKKKDKSNLVGEKSNMAAGKSNLRC